MEDQLRYNLLGKIFCTWMLHRSTQLGGDGGMSRKGTSRSSTVGNLSVTYQQHFGVSLIWNTQSLQNESHSRRDASRCPNSSRGLPYPPPKRGRNAGSLQ